MKKICPKCKETKDVSRFYKDLSKKDGMQGVCKLCRKEYNSRHYVANAEKIKLRARDYRIQHPEKVKAYDKEYRGANPEKIKRRKKEYREANPEKTKRYCKDYKETVSGNLHAKFSAMTFRCEHQKSYVNMGIKNEFESAEQLIDYVVNILQVDPRGKHCHRIDNAGHYEPGNIEFLTRAEHSEAHLRLKREKVNV